MKRTGSLPDVLAIVPFNDTCTISVSEKYVRLNGHEGWIRDSIEELIGNGFETRDYRIESAECILVLCERIESFYIRFDENGITRKVNSSAR